MKRTVESTHSGLTGQVVRRGVLMAALTELVWVEWELPSTRQSSTTGYALSIAVSSFSQRMTERGLSHLQDR